MKDKIEFYKTIEWLRSHREEREQLLGFCFGQ